MTSSISSAPSASKAKAVFVGILIGLTVDAQYRECAIIGLNRARCTMVNMRTLRILRLNAIELSVYCVIRISCCCEEEKKNSSRRQACKFAGPWWIGRTHSDVERTLLFVVVLCSFYHFRWAVLCGNISSVTPENIKIRRISMPCRCPSSICVR